MLLTDGDNVGWSNPTVINVTFSERFELKRDIGEILGCASQQLARTPIEVDELGR